jgi:heme/copper-type cytochrome/quinol oxidase subunit 2
MEVAWALAAASGAIIAIGLVMIVAGAHACYLAREGQANDYNTRRHYQGERTMRIGKWLAAIAAIGLIALVPFVVGG